MHSENDTQRPPLKAERIFAYLEYCLECAHNASKHNSETQAYYWIREFNEMSMDIQERKINYV